MFNTRTVTQMLKVSRIMVKRTNLPRRGTTREVGGMISANRREGGIQIKKTSFKIFCIFHNNTQFLCCVCGGEDRIFFYLFIPLSSLSLFYS